MKRYTEGTVDDKTEVSTRIGKVVKSVGGFHSVRFDNGEELLLQARGRLKRRGGILVGDQVVVQDSQDEPVIVDALARTSQLVRPPIANVDTVIVVFATAAPDPSLDLVDRILAQTHHEGLDALIVFNKADLADNETKQELARPYRQAGYTVLFTSAQEGEGIEALAQAVGTRTAVMAGPSGAGKTSLLNALIDDVDLPTGEVSEKTSRGRHTTRAVQLLPLSTGGWIADSPGFSTLSLAGAEPRAVREWYPEFAPYTSQCRFQGCVHRTEPGCAVQEAVEEGRIDPGRYQRYLRLLEEVEDAYERRYD